MRILIIAPTPFFADRGCHVRIYEQARVLGARGHQITICTYHIGRDIDGIQTRRSLRIPWYSKLTAGPSAHKFYVDLFLLWTVIKSCIQARPDIIHAHLHEGIVIGKIASLLFRVPLVADLQGSLTGELLQHKFMKDSGLLYRVFYRAELMITRLPDATLTSSTEMLHWLSDHGQRPSQRTKVIADGVDTERFRPNYPIDGLASRLGLPSTAKVVGFLGLLTEYQGVHVLLESIPLVLKKTKHVHFLFMGYPNVEKYQEQSKLLGIDDYVTFTGKVDYEEVPKFLAMCSVGVSPKLLSSEANGKVLNYMAMGLPVVASDTPVNREILGDLGVYAEPGNARSLADALVKVLSEERYGLALGRRLRKKAEAEYSWRIIGDRIDETYRHLTSH